MRLPLRDINGAARLVRAGCVQRLLAVFAHDDSPRSSSRCCFHLFFTIPSPRSTFGTFVCSFSAMSSSRGDEPGGKKTASLYVRHMSARASADDIKELFRKHGEGALCFCFRHLS